MKEELLMEHSLWVFGYGSLVWKPGFQPGQVLLGWVRHSGTPAAEMCEGALVFSSLLWLLYALGLYT